MDTEKLKELAELRLAVDKYKPYYEKHVASVKEKALAEYGLSNDEVWTSRLTGDNEEVIKEQAKALATELELVQRNQPIDPGSMGNGKVSRTTQVNGYQQGQRLFKQLKDNGRLARNVTSVKVDNTAFKPVKPKQQRLVKRIFGR